MTTDTAAPDITTTATQPEASEETKALNAAIDSADGENREGEGGEKKPEGEEQPKKERTPEERERIRLQRKIDRLLQQRGELRAQLTRQPIERNNDAQQSDNETLSLSRQELQDLIDREARKLAPTIKQQQAVIERRAAIVQGLAKDWGKEKFDALASDLDDAFDGLTDRNGQPKPAADAIFEADDPRALIEYLADPDHADEAEAISRMSAVQAGRAIAKLETKLTAEKAKAKPQPSKAPAPLEEIRGQGSAPKSLFDLSDREFIKRRREQIANRR